MRILFGLGDAQVADPRAREPRPACCDISGPNASGRFSCARIRSCRRSRSCGKRGRAKPLKSFEREGAGQFARAIGAEVETDDLVAVVPSDAACRSIDGSTNSSLLSAA